MAGGMELHFFGLWNFKFRSLKKWQKQLLLFLRNFQGFSCKLRPLTNIFRTLENGHSIRHQSIPPLSAGRKIGSKSENGEECRQIWTWILGVNSFFGAWSPGELRWAKPPNCQSLAFSERGQLSQAIPQFHVERMLNKWMPITRFELQRNERRTYEDQILCFGEDMSSNER